jgi:hypothetical protein
MPQNPNQQEQPPDTSYQYGPFSDVLSKPMTPQPTQQPNGYEGKGTALMMFATKFLEGAQQSRRRKFEESEKEKMLHRDNFDAVHQQIMSGDYTEAAKKKADDVWRQRRFGDIQQQMSEQGKGQKGGGKNAQPENPLMHFARGMVTSLAGPTENKKNEDFGQHVHELLAIAKDPNAKFNRSELTGGLSDAVTKAQTGIAGSQLTVPGAPAIPIAGVPGAQDTRELLTNPMVAQAAQKQTAVGMNPTQDPALAMAMNTLPAPLSESQKVLEAKRLQEISASQADIEGGQPKSWIYTGPDGKPASATVIWKNGKLHDVQGKPLGAESPLLNGGHFTGPTDTAQVRANQPKWVLRGDDRTGLLTRIDMNGIEPERPTSVKFDPAMKRAMAVQAMIGQRFAQGLEVRQNQELDGLIEHAASLMEGAERIKDKAGRAKAEQELGAVHKRIQEIGEANGIQGGAARKTEPPPTRKSAAAKDSGTSYSAAAKSFWASPGTTKPPTKSSAPADPIGIE